MRRAAETYEVVFSPDKAEFRRLDDGILTHLEVTVPPERNVEIGALVAISPCSTMPPVDRSMIHRRTGGVMKGGHTCLKAESGSLLRVDCIEARSVKRFPWPRPQASRGSYPDREDNRLTGSIGFLHLTQESLPSMSRLERV